MGSRVTKFSMAIAAVSAVLMMTSAIAESPTAEEVTANPANAVMVGDLGEDLWEKVEAYLQADENGAERDWQLGTNVSNPSGGYIGWGQAPIRMDVSDERYGQARILAYFEAYSNAMGEFARTGLIDSGVETVNSSLRPQRQVDRMDVDSTDDFRKALAERIQTMAVAALDRGLERLGADSSALQSLDISEKRRLAEELVTRSMVVDAAARMRGVRTIATFENGRDVGVLILHSSRLERLAERILSGAAASPKSGDLTDVREKIQGLTDTDLLFQHGVRVLPDSEGIPIVLAFGQSSPAVTNGDSDRTIRMEVSQSRQIADAYADAAITEFLNSTVFAGRAVDVGVADFIDVEVSQGAMVRSQGSELFTDLNTVIRQAAQASISGVQTIRRWEANHPDTGHLYLGVVRMWTPSQHFQYSADGDTDSESSADQDLVQDEVDVKVRQSKDINETDW